MSSDVMNSENAGSSDAGAAEKGSAETNSEANSLSASADHSSEMTAAPAEPVKEESKAPDAAAPKAPEMGTTSASAAHNSAAGEPAEDSSAEFSAKDSAKDAPKDSAKDISAEALKPRPGSSLILIPPATRKAEGAQAGAAPKPGTGASSAPFATARGAKTSRISKGTLLRYGIPAVLGFCLLGVGIATGGQFFGGSSSVPAATAAATPAAGSATASNANAGKTPPVHMAAAVDPQTAELRRLTKKLTEEVHALQARVDSMHAAPAASSEDVRSLKKSIEALRASFESSKTETGATIAVLSSKVDHLQHETTARAQTPAPTERSARAEKPVAGAPVTTASVTHPGTAPHTTSAAPVETAMATPANAKPQTTAEKPEPKKKPEKLLANWVVRDVYRGVALIDGPEGSLEVTRGDPIPGAGTVESIERRNGGWVLVTSRGIVVSVRD